MQISAGGFQNQFWMVKIPRNHKFTAASRYILIFAGGSAFWALSAYIPQLSHRISTQKPSLNPGSDFTCFSTHHGAPCPDRYVSASQNGKSLGKPFSTPWWPWHRRTMTKNVGVGSQVVHVPIQNMVMTPTKSRNLGENNWNWNNTIPYTQNENKSELRGL